MRQIQVPSLPHRKTSLARVARDAGITDAGLLHHTDRLRTGATTGELKADLDHERIARECAALDTGLRVQWLTSGRSFDLVA